MKPPRPLTCCVCGAGTQGRQWWNRDTGYGICVPCADQQAERMGPLEHKDYYGIRGIHFDLKGKERKLNEQDLLHRGRARHV